MKLIGIGISVLLVSADLSAQTVRRFVFIDTATTINESAYLNNIRFNPTHAEVEKADSLSKIHVRLNKNDYHYTSEIQNYDEYFRQYVGYINERNEKVIFINCFCRLNDDWEKYVDKYILEILGGGSCYLSIRPNLDENECTDFFVNAPK